MALAMGNGNQSALSRTSFCRDQQGIPEDGCPHVINASDELLVVELRGKLEVIVEQELRGNQPQLLLCERFTDTRERTCHKEHAYQDLILKLFEDNSVP